MLFLCYTISVGLVEELVFRGVVFPLFMKGFLKSKRPVLIAAVFSCFFFSALHFVNLFNQPENLIGITSQVFFALSIGVFFSGIMVRTQNIIVPIVLHILINLSFGSGELVNKVKDTTSVGQKTGVNWSSIIPTTIFFAFIFLSGVYMILKSDKKTIFNKLK